MSLFRPYKFKAKPDIPDNMPVKHGFFLFFELFFRKFWRFITVNLYYFLVLLPLIIYVYFAVNGYFAEYLISETGEFRDMLAGVGIYASIVNVVPEWLYTPLLILSAVLYGPATMGVTYIYRNFAREEHAWMSDFVSRALSNFRQGLFFGILDLLVFFLLANGILGHIVLGTGTVGAVLSIAFKTLAVIALIVYLFMRHYFYTIAVSVNLGCFAILKNSWLFVVLGFWRNCWAGIVCLLVTVLCFFTLPIVSLIALPTLYFSLTGFMVVFTCYPVVKRYIILPAMEQAEKEKNGGAAPEMEAIAEVGSENETVDGGDEDKEDTNDSL